MVGCPSRRITRDRNGDGGIAGFLRPPSRERTQDLERCARGERAGRKNPAALRNLSAQRDMSGSLIAFNLHSCGLTLQQTASRGRLQEKPSDTRAMYDL